MDVFASLIYADHWPAERESTTHEGSTEPTHFLLFGFDKVRSGFSRICDRLLLGDLPARVQEISMVQKKQCTSTATTSLKSAAEITRGAHHTVLFRDSSKRHKNGTALERYASSGKLALHLWKHALLSDGKLTLHEDNDYKSSQNAPQRSWMDTGTACVCRRRLAAKY